MSELQTRDPEAYELLQREVRLRRESIDLVPSDNHPSAAVREAERYPLFYSENDGRNYYYPGCATIAAVEALARQRALACFPGSEHVNVKPTDGTRANEAAYRSVLKEGDVILSLALAEGGHLSHGLKHNYSGQLYRPVHYHLDPGGFLDMEEVRRLALEHRPKLIIAGGSSCAFHFDFAAFAEIAREVDALLHADISHFAGLVVAGHHPSPFPHADMVMTTLQKTLRGVKGAIVFARSGRSRELDRAVFPGVMAHATGGQLLAKAVALGEALRPEFRGLIDRVVRNARRLAGALTDRGFKIVTGGTQTHLMVADLTELGITGKEAEARLEAAGLLANKQLVPRDPRPPTVCSGIRLGTPSASARGMDESEMDRIAAIIDRLLRRGESPESLRPEVLELARAFPIPGE